MTDTMHFFIEAVGWIAAALILTGYALVTSGRLQARSLTFQGLNILGAAGFIVNSGWNGALPSAVLNVIWLGIGIWASWSILKANKARKS